MTKVPARRGSFYWKKDTPYVSVTNALNVIDKPALRYWFGQQVFRAYAADPNLSEKEALQAPWNVTKKAADRGTTVHSIVESWKHTKKQIDTVPDKYRGYAEAFYKWVESNHVEVIENERSVYSDKYQYAGTLDMLAKINGRKDITIVDIKTGKNLYPEVQLQISAYRQALKEQGIEATMSALLLKEDGSYKYEEYTEDRLEPFLACLKLWQWKNEDKYNDAIKYRQLSLIKNKK